MIYLKSQEDIAKIKQAAEIWKKTRAVLIEATKPGVSLITLDRLADETIRSYNATCSFYQYEEFPKHICISVNEQLIHGIPGKYVIKPNDLITFDIGVTYQDHICDAAFSLVVAPSNNEEANRINKVTLLALDESLKLIKPGNTIGDIGAKISEIATTYGYEVIKDFTGHGCGNHVHEDPLIPCYGKPHSGLTIRKNMVLCIEPMLLTNTDQYIIDPKNGWTVISKNKKLTCHWEHMVLVTEEGCEILTK